MQLFKLAVQEADARKPVLFRELKHSFEAAHLAGICLVAATKPMAREMPDLALVLRAATRVGREQQEGMRAALERSLTCPAKRADEVGAGEARESPGGGPGDGS